MNDRATPSLRIARLVISNFRTFHGPIEIPLASGGVADEMPVFHGGNGTGKSNALAALDLFFRASAYLLRRREGISIDINIGRWNERDDYTGLVISPRDWPPGIRDPLAIEVEFSDGLFLKVKLMPAGNEVMARLEMLEPLFLGNDDAEELALTNKLRSRLEAPLGPESKPLFILGARRRHYRSPGEGQPSDGVPATPLSAEMATLLANLATSLDPGETERWRAFVGLVGRIPTLQGREVSIVRTPEGADLRFEIRGRQILRLSELSSGEQQVVAICAAVLTSRAAIVAIEEPEISLHPDNQRLIRDILLEQVRSGLVDQILLESHVPTFDGPEVIRFTRGSDGATSVARQPSAANDELRGKARTSGAADKWVTAEGYTQLPEAMIHDLGVQAGGHVWFLRPSPERHWEAWAEGELDQMFGAEDAPSEK